MHEIGVVPCTLVFMDARAAGSPNDRHAGPFSYVAQALTLNRSLLAAGLPRLTIATNVAERINAWFADVRADERPVIFPLRSSLDLPKDTAFYGAHFKLDLLEQMAPTLPERTLLLLLDADIIAQHGFDTDLLRRCFASGVGAFDISDQEFFAYGAARVVADLERVAGVKLANPRWFGGECLLATKGLIDRLVPVARACFRRYRDLVHELNHQGDEAFMSAALNMLSDCGQQVIDVGAYRLVGRYWSGNTHRDLRWFRHCALLHLPDCKALLVREASRPGFSVARIWRQVFARHQIYRCVWMLRLRRGVH